VLDRYSNYELSWSQVQKQVERIKSQASCHSLFIPNANDPSFPPPVNDIRIPGQIRLPQYLLTGPTSTGVGLLSSTDSAYSLGRDKGGWPNGTTHEVKRQKDET
jgi:hypothetical protein